MRDVLLLQANADSVDMLTLINNNISKINERNHVIYPMKASSSRMRDEAFLAIIKKYNIKGFPTLIIDSRNEEGWKKIEGSDDILTYYGRLLSNEHPQQNNKSGYSQRSYMNEDKGQELIEDYFREENEDSESGVDQADAFDKECQSKMSEFNKRHESLNVQRHKFPHSKGNRRRSKSISSMKVSESAPINESREDKNADDQMLLNMLGED